MASKHLSKASRSLLLLLFVGLFADESSGYGKGAPSSAGICEIMLPGHGAETQTTPSPYEIDLSKSNLMGGDKLTIKLTAPENEFFKGFLVLVKKTGDAKKPFGQFSIMDPLIQTINCLEQKASAVTHTSGAEKTNVTFEWIAPNEEDLNDLEVVVTFVGKEFDQIWQAVKHPEKITVKRNAALQTALPVEAKLSPETLKKLKEFYSPCMEGNVGCLGLPAGCIETFMSEQKNNENPTTCNVMISWSANGLKNVYKMTGKPGDSTDTKGYIAMGFSEDKAMSKDSVVGCYVSSAGTDLGVQRFKNPGQFNVVNDDPKLGLKALSTSFAEGNIFCEFEQTDHSIQDIIDVKLREKSYFILLARGGNAADSGLTYHGTSTSDNAAVSGESLAVTDNGIHGSASSSLILIRLHGSFMIVAWLLCASSGMFTARYYKLTHTEFMPFNKAFWFVLHITCMFSTVVLTACGAIFIFIKKGGWTPEEGKNWHPILGVILFGLAIFQVLIAFLRPHPGTKFRPLFNWVHWLVGNSAHIVGIACIFLANDLPAAGLDREEYLFTALGAVLFHIVLHLIMSFHTLWADKQMDTKTKRAVHPGPMKPNGLSSEAPGTGFRSFLMALYIMGLLGCAIALIFFICVPKE